MEYTELQADIKTAYAMLADYDKKEAARLAEVEMSERRIAKKELLNGTRIPRCRCLACITAICMLEKPNPRKCENAIRKPEPRTPGIEIE